MSIYKDCDIRGIYGREFDDDTAYDIGRAIGSRMTGKSLAVGGDVRISTPALKGQLIEGLLASGANVTDLGMVPTPAFYYAIKAGGHDGGVTVTASHNPPQYNGFKLALSDMPVSGADIEAIEDLVKRQAFVDGAGALRRGEALERYTAERIGQFSRGSGKLVVDCCNGAMSVAAPEVFGALGYEVAPLYCSYDGRFPNRSPNPAQYEHLGDLCRRVVEEQADLGIAFDGDGDRVVFVDDLGRTVPSEQSFALMIRELVKAGESVVYDLKSSSVVKNEILRQGGVPMIERSGHAFIKRRFLENRSALAGEISGHFFFRALGYDDGLYAALVMAEIIGRAKRPLSTLVDSLERTVISPDIRVFCPYDQRDGWIERMKELKGARFTTIDGVHADFGFGWVLMRKSVTEEGVTLRIEAQRPEQLLALKRRAAAVLPELLASDYFSDLRPDSGAPGRA